MFYDYFSVNWFQEIANLFLLGRPHQPPELPLSRLSLEPKESTMHSENIGSLGLTRVNKNLKRVNIYLYSLLHDDRGPSAL